MTFRIYNVRHHGFHGGADGWITQTRITKAHVVSWSGDTQAMMSVKYPGTPPRLKVKTVDGVEHNIEGVFVEDFDEWMSEDFQRTYAQ